MTDRIWRILLKQPASLLIFSFMLSLVSAPSLPMRVEAAQNPVNLVLDNGVSTHLSVTNIHPGDIGASWVMLHNAGTSDGIVSVWISNLVGINVTAIDPKYAGSSACLSDYLLFNISCSNLETNFSLPKTLSAFPRAASSAIYIRINPLKSGQTINLTWKWELPATAGNEVQGKGVSFDINYVLEEIPQPAAPGGEGAPEPTQGAPPAAAPPTSITVPTLSVNLLGDTHAAQTDANGALLQPLRITNSADDFVFEMGSGGRIVSSEGVPVTRIEVKKTEESFAVPAGTVLLSPMYKITGYIGETPLPTIRFEPSSMLTIRYDATNLPENTFAPYIAYCSDSGIWTVMEKPADSVLEPGKTEAVIYHASMYAVLAKIAPSPEPIPASFIFKNLRITPRQVEQEKPVTIVITVENNGAANGNYELYLMLDGIIQAVQEVDLDGFSSRTVSFTVSNLAPGIHRIKVAGMTGEFQVLEPAAASPVKQGMGWGFIDLVVGLLIAGLLAAIFMIIRKSRRIH